MRCQQLALNGFNADQSAIALLGLLRSWRQARSGRSAVVVVILLLCVVGAVLHVLAQSSPQGAGHATVPARTARASTGRSPPWTSWFLMMPSLFGGPRRFYGAPAPEQVQPLDPALSRPAGQSEPAEDQPVAPSRAKEGGLAGVSDFQEARPAHPTPRWFNRPSRQIPRRSSPQRRLSPTTLCLRTRRTTTNAPGSS